MDVLLPLTTFAKLRSRLALGTFPEPLDDVSELLVSLQEALLLAWAHPCAAPFFVRIALLVLERKGVSIVD